MFIRQKKNKSGSISVQIISKANSRYKVIQTIGSSLTPDGISLLVYQAKHTLSGLQKQSSLFVSEDDASIESFLNTLHNAQISVIGPELIFGKIYNAIGFNVIKEDLFRHLVISRLAFPLSKLKTIDYLYRYQGIRLNINTVYRFLDRLNSELKQQVEQIAYQHTLKVLKNKVTVVFYDMTTLYFEASDEDDLRKTGFSKEGKHQNPQIYLGLLVSLGGYVIGYDIFEGSIYEGHTLIPVIEKLSKKFNLSKPIVVADAGLLSSENMSALEQDNYEYILGARIKGESNQIKQQILAATLNDGEHRVIEKQDGKLIVAYSANRARKDSHNRKRGLQRLEKQIKSGKLTKSNINNKGYNKYLKMKGEVTIEIDYNKYEQDAPWDGLKGYITNASLPPDQIIDNYKNLWQIEKAFRMSKTDLRIRPIYHRLAQRIEAHICVSFTAYAIYKELERILYKANAPFSVKRAAELTQNMYQLKVVLPKSQKLKTILLKMDEHQTLLTKIIDENY
ncbi:MAG: IS1634 family transposase [Chitinophagaceae bacterium]